MASINDVEISEGQGTLPVLLGRTQAAEQDDPEAVGKDGEKEHDAADRVTTQPSNMEVLSETTWAEKLSLVVGGILALAQGVSTPLIAVFTADSIGLLTTSDPSNLLETMTPVLWKIGILAVAQFLLAWWWQWCMHWSAAKQASRWHIKFIKQLMTLDVPWYDANDSAGLAARLQADIGALYIFMSAGLGFLISCAGQFFAGITLAFVKSWQLSLAACAVTPFLVFTGHRLGKEIEEQYSQQAEDFQRASTVAEESLMAIRTVVAFGGEASAMRRFERELTRAKMGGIRSSVKIGIAWGGLNFAYNVLYALTLWLGGHVLMKEGAPLEESRNVVVVMIALIVGVSGISMFSEQAPVLARAIASAKGMKKVINCRAHDIEPEGFALPPLPEELQVIESVEFKSVCFRYPMRPDQPVLKNLSFEVKKGQKIALVGESGCGKSTTIQLLERFYDPEAGEILINGIPLFQLPVKSWRKLIGFVGQEPVLFATSAMNNLRMGDDSITEEEAIKAAKDAQIYEALSVLPQQFDTFVGLGGNLLSGGQRQRVAIARALAKRPQILLLDEATSALDNESERMVQETLDALQSNVERSLTTISIAHRLTSIMASDVIYVLKDGAVCEHGTHDDLVNMKAVYYNMAALQHEEPQEEEKPEAAAVEASYNRGGTMMSKASTQTYIIDKPQEQAAGHTSAGVFCRLFRTARPDWVILPFLLLVVLLSSVATPFQALFFNQGIGGLFMPEQLDFLNKACLGLIMTGFVGGAAVMLQNSLSTYLQENLSLNLRKLTFESIIYLDIGFFDAPENQVGSILVSLERHMTRVAQMLGINLANTVGGVLTCVICVIFSFFGSWILAVALLIMMPLFTFMGIKVSVLAHIPSKKAELAYAVSGQTTTEAATQIRTVRALGAEKQILEILSESLQVLTDFNVRTAWKKGAAFGLTTVLIQVMYLAGFWLSAGMIQSGAFDSNQVLLTLFCVVFGVMSVSTLSQYLPDSASGHLAVTEVFRLIDQDSKINCKKQKEGGIESFGDGSIVFKDVNFWYPHRPEVKVLKHVSFSVQKGQSVALVGFSGSGKSTVIQLLQRFYDPQGGCILVGGQNLRNFKLAWWRRNIGMVSQEEPVLFDMSLEENVKYGYPEATPSQVQDAARIAHIEYAFNGTVKWTDRVGLRGEKLSGGQKQRCAIARALLRRPQILLLDEATSALDSHSERLVQDAMQDARVGKTTITVAHRLSTIRSADMILVLNGGKLVERGTYSELIALEGAFSKLARSL